MHNLKEQIIFRFIEKPYQEIYNLGAALKSSGLNVREQPAAYV
ncbi:hypothetical protein [Acinetobacter tianfuensis]|nr:hypothetical protein [Acinetobacter tianfuensis]